MMFRDREEAALLLLERLRKSKLKNVVIAGIPRGAVPMARTIAEGMRGELSVVLAHKIPSPDNPEFAVGCVGLSGHVSASYDAKNYGISDSYLQNAAAEELRKIRARKDQYGLVTPDWKGKKVIIIDDGVATGSTATCAVHEARALGAEKVIFATPISSDDAAEKLTEVADEFISLYVSSTMLSIGEFYEVFPQVSDEEVLSALHGGSKEGQLTFMY